MHFFRESESSIFSLDVLILSAFCYQPSLLTQVWIVLSLFWIQTKYLIIVYLIHNKLLFHGRFYCHFAPLFNVFIEYIYFEYIHVSLASKLQVTWEKRLLAFTAETWYNTLHIVGTQLFLDFSFTWKILKRKETTALVYLLTVSKPANMSVFTTFLIFHDDLRGPPEWTRSRKS